MQAKKKTAKTRRKPSARAKPGELKLVSNNRWDLPAPLLAIVDEHKYVSRLLPMLEDEAEKLSLHGNADYECMEDIMHYLVNYPDRYHHPKEDLIFERMSAVSSSTANTIARLQNDHEKMAVQAETILDRITSVRNPKSRKEQKSLAEEIKLYSSSLRKHMALEEREVLEPARDCLSDEDWKEIDLAIAPIIDPIFGDAISDRYVRLMQRYLNDFVTVASSGSFPIKVVESGISKVEQAIYTTFELKDLAKLLFKTSSGILKGKISHLGTLTRVRSLADLTNWRATAKVENTKHLSEWDALTQELKEIIDSTGKAGWNEEIHDDISTIKLKTEKEILAYQEKPYVPEENPKTSWQAAAMNLLMRVSLKPMMRHVDIENLKSDNRFVQQKSDFVFPGTRIEPLKTDTIHADWIMPQGTTPRKTVILYLPGGGFISPASNMHRKLLGKLVWRSRQHILLVHYRLLPDHPFPAGLEDALAAYRYLLEDGVRPEDIILGGDSAGGTLALSLMMSARDEGLPMPGACFLISPLTDLSFSTATRTSNRWKDPLLPSIRKADAYHHYAGERSVDDPLVSPIYGTFEKFPRTFALVSSTETLLDDTLIVARKARSQGVDFEVEIWPSLPHAWPIFSFLPEADTAVNRLCEYIESVMARDERKVPVSRSAAAR